MITVKYPPLQSLMDYVFKTYSELESRCTSEGNDVVIEDCVDCHSDSYYGGNTQYKCGNSKKVYLVRYMAAQIKQIDLALSQSLRQDISSQQHLKAISLGGGPGTEIIALMDILRTYDGNFSINFDNVDSEKSWKNIFEDLTHRFANKISNIELKPRFFPSDLKNYANRAKVLYDIAFVSWLFSLVDKPQEILSILNTIKQLLNEDGYLIVADRFEDEVVANISEAVGNIDGLILIEHDRQIQWCGVMFPEDIKDVFKVRLRANGAYWILQKASELF